MAKHYYHPLYPMLEVVTELSHYETQKDDEFTDYLRFFLVRLVHQLTSAQELQCSLTYFGINQPRRGWFSLSFQYVF